MEVLGARFSNKRIIDITDDLTNAMYREYQTKNYYTNIVMIAEKTATNEEVFINRRNNSESDIIVMYNGSYRTFPYTTLEVVLESLAIMIS